MRLSNERNRILAEQKACLNTYLLFFSLSISNSTPFKLQLKHQIIF